MEPNYELRPMFSWRGGRNGQPHAPVFSAYDVRKSYYRIVLHGAVGFTYGCEPIRQPVREGDQIHMWEKVGLPTWREARPLARPLGYAPTAAGDGVRVTNRLRSRLQRSWTSCLPESADMTVPAKGTVHWPTM